MVHFLYQQECNALVQNVGYRFRIRTIKAPLCHEPKALSGGMGRRCPLSHLTRGLEKRQEPQRDPATAKNSL